MDPAELAEHDLLVRNGRAADLEAPELLAAEGADEEVVLPAGIARAGVERDPARRDRRREGDDRRLHAFFRPLRDPRLNAVRDDRPAVVMARLDDVDLVASLRAVLRFPELAGDRIPREALRVAVAVAPDRRYRPGTVHEGIVLRHAPIVVHAMDLAGGLRKVLRVHHLLLLADREEQMILLVEDEARPVVRVRRAVDLRRRAEEDLLIDPFVVIVDA